jgi:predicted PurR-regulated permease PerM
MAEKFTGYRNEIITWTSANFDVSPQKIIAWIAKTKSDLINTSGLAIGTTLVNVGNSLVVVLLIPVYIFMILFYQPLLIEFLRRIFGADHRTEVNSIITQVKKVIQRYLTGLVIEAVIVATLDTIALLILGIEYAVLLGILGALLNVIPYLGGLVAVALPMAIALVTKNTVWYPLYVLAAYYFIQVIDNNYIVPKIVASKVKINALVSIVVVLAFGALWGIPGMFISIPLTAIVKLIFDHIEPLKPWGFLLGDTMPSLAIFKLKLKKKQN